MLCRVWHYLKEKIYASGTFSLCVNSFTVFTLMFFAPLEVFLGNINEFIFTFGEIWWMLLLFCVGIIVVGTLIECLLPKKLITVCNLFVFSLGLCAYVQSVFLNGKMGSLTGEEDVYSHPTVFLNNIIWITVIMLVFSTYFVIKKFGKREIARKSISLLALALVLMQTTGLVSAVIGTDHPSGRSNWRLSRIGEFSLSKKSNIVVFIIDTCDTRYAESALQEDPALFDSYTGFTYYTGATSTHSRTYPSLPYLLTGEICHFDTPINDYIEQAYQNSSFLSDLSARNYKIGLYTDNQYLGKANSQIVENFKYNKDTKIQLDGLVRQMGLISLYRNAPYAFKQRFQYVSNTVNEKVVGAEDDCIEEDDAKFYSVLNEQKLDAAENEDGIFRFYHFWGAHPGAQFDENLNTVQKGDMINAIRGDFKIISEYISQMKELGIYDCSTIIITADHGSSSGNSAQKPLEIDTAPCVLMMVKQAGADSNLPMVRSDAPVSHADFFATVIDAAGGDSSRYGQPISDYLPGEERTRYYYNTALYSDKDGEIALREYAVTGDARDFSNWKLTGNNWDIDYSERAVSKHRLSEVLHQQ